MSNAKYKVGDRLKVVAYPGDDWAGSDWNIGDYFEVKHVDIWKGESPIYWSTGPEDGDTSCGVYEEHLELADIADSPLYKALK